MKSKMKITTACLLALLATACGSVTPVGIVSTWAPSPSVEAAVADLEQQKLALENQTHEVAGGRDALLLKYHQVGDAINAIDAEILAVQARDERDCFALHSDEPTRIMPHADAAYARCMQSRGYTRLTRRATLGW